ncbi:MAG: tetratricopeptide repeat protein [Proteobacteria bacterium]|nr:tetratricopeptide repeat protein [Pseudomonadota bacterium]
MTSNTQALLNKAKHHLASVELIQARDTLSCILSKDPDHAESHRLLGLILLKEGDPKSASDVLKIAVKNDPKSSYFIDYAMALHLGGATEAAIMAVRRAIAITPDNLLAHKKLGDFLEKAENWNTARRENLEKSYVQLAAALRKQNRTDTATRVITAVLERSPNFWPAVHELIVCQQEQALVAEAEATCRTFLTRHPKNPEANHAMGIIMERSGDLKAAEDFFNKAIDLVPDYAAAQFALAQVLLLSGRYSEGWPKYDHWLWKKPEWASKKRQFDPPEWDGSSLGKRTLFLHVDHGLGDLIQFARFILLIPKEEGRIILECPRPLMKLFSSIRGVDQVVAFPPKDPLPEFDVQYRLMGLATLFRITLATLPVQSTPYLVADKKMVSQWKPIIDKGKGDLRVGLIWAGNPEFESDGLRSPGLKSFQLFMDIPGVCFFSLQKGAGLLELDASSKDLSLIDFSDRLQDMSQTAAAMANMDLIISSCTAPLHLAGALGIRAWAVLPFSPSWRWLTDREDSPWYPSLRLFRQASPGDWEAVSSQIKRQLQRWIQMGGNGSDPSAYMNDYWPGAFETGSLFMARQVSLPPTKGLSTNQRWEKETPWLLKVLEDYLNPDDTTWILDFGCGLGRMAKALIDRHHCWVLGVDISLSMRARAEIFVNSPRFISCSPQALDQMTQQGFRVDHAISVWTLQHCPAMEEEVARIQASLKKGGRLYVLSSSKNRYPTRHGWVDTHENIKRILDKRFKPLEKIPLPDKVFLDRSPKNTISLLYENDE